jgi:hypothetical protein
MHSKFRILFWNEAHRKTFIRLASLQSFRIFGQIISEIAVCYHEDAFYIDIVLCINILENSYPGDNLSKSFKTL